MTIWQKKIPLLIQKVIACFESLPTVFKPVVTYEPRIFVSVWQMDKYRAPKLFKVLAKTHKSKQLNRVIEQSFGSGLHKIFDQNS